ncbi:MAG: ATP-binding protein [Candidatus Bipolaricaulota bacterium]
MKITQISVDNYGPLGFINWDVPDVGVVYDDNMTGKTSLVDVLVRQLFIPQEGSKLFEDYQRFTTDSSEKSRSITIEIEKDGRNFLFGTEDSNNELKDLFGWTEEALFRLLCIREGDNRLVTGSWDRRSVFNAAASLISGVGTEKVDLIDKDLREEFRITKGNNWSNRKGTAPPKIKNKIEEDIVPFLDDFDNAEKKLHLAKEKRSEIDKLEKQLEKKTQKEKKLEGKLNLVRAEKLEEKVDKLRRLNQKREEFARISTEDEEEWRVAKEQLERAREKLLEKDYQGKTLEERKKAVKSKREEKEKLLNVNLGEKIRSRRERLQKLEEKEQGIIEKIDEARGQAIESLKREVREPLKRLAKEEEKLHGLTFWEQQGSPLTWISAVLIVGGGAATLVLPWPVAFISLLGLGLLALTKRRISHLENLNRKIASLKDEIRKNFNAKFGDLFHRPLSDVESIEKILEEIPGRVEQNIKNTNNFQNIEKEKRELKRELEDLEQEKERLPEKIEKLKAEAKKLEESIGEANVQKKRNKETLNDLRDKTNLPDLATLQKRLEEKNNLESQIKETEAVLTNELNTETSDLNDLIDCAEKKINELRKDKGNEVKEDSRVLDGLERDVERLGTKLEELKSEVERLRKEVREERAELEDLRGKLSQFNVDLENPAELFHKKMDTEESLRRFALDRIAGSLARKIFDEVSSSYLNSLDRYISGEGVGRTVEELFREVMGNRFKLQFNFETNQFVIDENGLTYPETDLSSGGKKHLFYSTRLALVERIVPETAFLVLDDPYLFYQKERKKKAIKQLKAFIEDGWQVLCFTVDDQTRDAMASELNAEEFSIENMEV